VALVAALALAGCTSPGLDAEQSAATHRTCASLRERVANRVLDRFGVTFGEDRDEDGDDAKLDDLDPRVLLADPERFYAALEARIEAADLGPWDAPSPVSPATRIVEACRRLEP
jgi:hypothetical protein